tara:strand:+ start:249 stop:947 length:699 start_codon:yes stop_codon:yes gene_type:complete
MNKRAVGFGSSLFKTISQREKNFIQYYVDWSNEEAYYIPTWFEERYEGDLSRMKPSTVAFLLSEMLDVNKPYIAADPERGFPRHTDARGIMRGPISLREAGYDPEERRSISHLEAGTDPRPQRSLDSDPNPWETYSHHRRMHMEAVRIYKKLLKKLKRRRPDDVEGCNMHAETALGSIRADGYSGYLEDYKLWRGMEIEDKSEEEVKDELWGTTERPFEYGGRLEASKYFDE